VTIRGIKTRKGDVGAVGPSVAYAPRRNLEISLKGGYGNSYSSRFRNDYAYWHATAGVELSF